MTRSGYLLIYTSSTTYQATAIRTHERTFLGGKTAEFAHDAHQLVVIVSGAAAVQNNSGTWAVPGGCGAWIPAGVRHAIEPTPEARARTLYIHARHRKFRRTCATLTVTPLLRAIVGHLDHHAANRNLIAVAIDQLMALRELPLFLPRPASARARRIADVLSYDPADVPRIHDIATELRVSARTIERAFTADTGLSLGEWRQRARILRAIGLLAGGMDVKEVALEVGYGTPSAFVVAFKKYVGRTPGKV